MGVYVVVPIRYMEIWVKVEGHRPLPVRTHRACERPPHTQHQIQCENATPWHVSSAGADAGGVLEPRGGHCQGRDGPACAAHCPGLESTCVVPGPAQSFAGLCKFMRFLGFGKLSYETSWLILRQGLTPDPSMALSPGL